MRTFFSKCKKTIVLTFSVPNGYQLTLLHFRRQLPPKEEEKNDSPFGAIKLKKAETVKRTWDDGGLESVDLKHHEFEKVPEDESVSNCQAFRNCAHTTTHVRRNTRSGH